MAELHLSGVRKLLIAPGGEDLDLVLINAIQYQTSLGHPTHRFRDEVFHLAWTSDRIGRANFQSRIEPLWRAQSRDVIVNCCTGGERSKTSLKRLVYDALREITDNNSMLSPLVVGCAHPSSWRRNKNNREAKVMPLPPRQNVSNGVTHV
ncbi:hypothetical protein ADM96_19560 [Burkholderia sp. ST111]|nr:hypothetical protein ADM96_19560 [Burkholderia sp. ST111]